MNLDFWEVEKIRQNYELDLTLVSNVDSDWFSGCYGAVALPFTSRSCLKMGRYSFYEITVSSGCR